MGYPSCLYWQLSPTPEHLYQKYEIGDQALVVSGVPKWLYYTARFRTQTYETFQKYFAAFHSYFLVVLVLSDIITPSAISSIGVILLCFLWYVISEGLVHLHVLVSNAVWFFLIICFRTRIFCAPSCGKVTCWHYRAVRWRVINMHEGKNQASFIRTPIL